MIGCDPYPASTMKRSSLFHESAKYVPLPYAPIATILMVISIEKKAKMRSSKSCRNRRKLIKNVSL